MNIDKLTKKSILIITEYYKNNLLPYFQSVDEEIIWIGPAKGQFLRGKQALLHAWEKESHTLTFTMGSISSTYITTNNNFCEIILNYEVTTHYPDGHSIARDQVLHYTWCERMVKHESGHQEKEAKILMIHISNSLYYDSRDTIYPVHLPEKLKIETKPVINEQRILINGKNYVTYSIPVNQIMWIESTNKGLHAILHTVKEEIVTIKPVSYIANLYPHEYLRIHSSYLINPNYAIAIRRFEIELSDGTVLPVPEKKYTAIKKLLLTGEYFIWGKK